MPPKTDKTPKAEPFADFNDNQHVNHFAMNCYRWGLDMPCAAAMLGLQPKLFGEVLVRRSPLPAFGDMYRRMLHFYNGLMTFLDENLEEDAADKWMLLEATDGPHKGATPYAWLAGAASPMERDTRMMALCTYLGMTPPPGEPLDAEYKRLCQPPKQAEAQAETQAEKPAPKKKTRRKPAAKKKAAGKGQSKANTTKARTAKSK